jgi:DNA-binding NarL/FixJ family response regulator
MEKIKIYIVDDHKLFVEGLTSLLSDDTDFKIVDYSLSANEFLKIYKYLDVDIYLMDINIPDIPGTQLTSMLKNDKPDAKILALTMYDDFDYVEKMISSGANGYILKSASIEELSLAIRTVAGGGKYFGSDIQDVVFSKIADRTKGKNSSTDNSIAHLTRREKEIISLIAQEYTTHQIAEKLFISERTVETHRKNIFSKTKVKSVIGLSRFAVKHGIIREEGH